MMIQKGFRKGFKNAALLLITILALVLSSVLIYAGTFAPSHLITLENFNFSAGSSTAGGGFVVSSTSGHLTNGSSLRTGLGAGAITTSNSSVNLSGIINLNISFILNASHGHYLNVTFGWHLAETNASFMLNTTVFNNTVNQSSFNYSFNTNVLLDGMYNISVWVENANASANQTNVVNYSTGYAVIDNTPPNITAFHLNNVTNGSNITGGVLHFNVTINDSITYQFASIELQNNFNNGTSGIGFNVTLVRNFTGIYHTALVLSTMTDGFYTVRVHANDTLGNINSSVVNLSFTLDRTPPNVTSASLLMGNLTGYGTESSVFGYNFSAGLSEGNLTLQVVINDSVTSVHSVRFNISNRSGPVVNVYNFTGAISYSLFGTKNKSNYTSGWVNGSAGVAMGAFNLSRLAEGWYNLTVIANDSLNNRNTTVRMAFVIDRTNPGVTVTCSPSSPTAGDIVTCTCTSSDDYPGSGVAPGWGFPGSSSTESTTSSGTGTFTSGTCRANDHAGNTKTATGSWTVTAASTGGGGSGGSGGGSSVGVSGNFEKKVWTSLLAGETAIVPVRNSELAVTEVSFAVSDTTYGAWVQVKKVDTLPSSVAAFEGKTYRTLDIQERNVASVLKDTATIKFKVEKSWLEENQLIKNKVALFRFVDDKWNQLPTTVGADDGTYISYTAETPGFSYFAIGEAKEAVGGSEEEEEEAAAREAAEEAAPEAAAPKRGLSGGVIALIVMVVIVIAGIAVWYWKKK